MRVRMPSFTFAPGEAEAVADYFSWKAVKHWPARFTRELRLAQGLAEQALAEAVELPPQTVRAIENGGRAETEASFAQVLAWAESNAFRMEPAVDPNYEQSVLRSHAYLARREAEEPGHLATGERIAIEAVNCFQCHFRLGAPPPADPIAWAPDLVLTHDRLREDWVARWLTDPGRVYPGTSMPANFAGDPPQYQAIYPDSNNASSSAPCWSGSTTSTGCYLDRAAPTSGPRPGPGSDPFTSTESFKPCNP